MLREAVTLVVALGAAGALWLALAAWVPAEAPAPAVSIEVEESDGSWWLLVLPLEEPGDEP